MLPMVTQLTNRGSNAKPGLTRMLQTEPSTIPQTDERTRGGEMELMILRSREGPGRVFFLRSAASESKRILLRFFKGIDSFQESSSYPKFTVKDLNLKTWYGIPYMWTLKRNDTDELMKQKETYRLRKRTYDWQGDGMVREFGVDMYTLLCSE